MANSTTNLDLISSSQASKEITANALFDSMSPASVYGRRASTSVALTWGFYGGNVTKSDGTMVQIVNGTVSLTASTTNYLVAEKATGTVSVSTNTTNWNNMSAYWRLYSIVAGASSVTSYTDYRQLALFTVGASRTGVHEMNFAYGDASPATIITAPSGKVVKEVQIHITTAFDGTGAALTVGDVASTDRLLAASDVDVFQVGANYTHPAYAYGSDTEVNLYITPGAGASQGAGVVVIVLQG